jgi:hypothetical protein
MRGRITRAVLKDFAGIAGQYCGGACLENAELAAAKAVNARFFGTSERFQAKWKPVRVKKTHQVKNLEARFDFIEAGL